MGKSTIGGFNPSEKYYSVGMIIPNEWKNKNCSKPPTRNTFIEVSTVSIFPSNGVFATM